MCLTAARPVKPRGGAEGSSRIFFGQVSIPRQGVRDWDERAARAARVFGGGLLPPDTATVVRAQGGKVVTTDGPFAETKEQLGGFWVIKVADLDAALDYAARASEACRNPVEVRPFEDFPGE